VLYSYRSRQYHADRSRFHIIYDDCYRNLRWRRLVSTLTDSHAATLLKNTVSVRPSSCFSRPRQQLGGVLHCVRYHLFTTSLRGCGRDIFSKRRWNTGDDDGLYRGRPNSPPASSRSSTNESIHPSILTHEQHNLAGSSQVLLRARPDRSTTVEAIHQTLTKESQHEEPSGSGLSSVTGDELHKTRTSGTIWVPRSMGGSQYYCEQ